MVPGGLGELKLHAVGWLGQEQMAAARFRGKEAVASGGSAQAGGGGGGGWLGQEQVAAVRFFFRTGEGDFDWSLRDQFKVLDSEWTNFLVGG